MTAPDRTLLEDRYGTRPARTSKRTYWLLGASALIVSALVAWVAYVNLGSAPIETQSTSFENLPDNAMEMTFEITRDEPSRPVVCIVRALALDGTESGRKEVLVPPGDSATWMTTVIQNRAEPVTANVFGCSYQVPEYLSTELPPTG